MNFLAGIFFALFFGFIPMFLFALIVYWLDRYEKEPAILLGVVFLWGAIFAAGAAFIVNTLLGLSVYIFTGSETATELTTGSLFAPLVEESLKGLAVLAIFLLFRHEFDSILDGIVYAGITALGFAATENAYYIFAYGYQENGLQGALWLVVVRVLLVGWQHPFYTAFTGIGLAIARLSRYRAMKIIAPALGFFVSIFMHSLHNTLASLFSGTAGLATVTFLDWSGWFLMFLFIFWAIYREQRWITIHLREEVALGVISPAQYRTACSAWAQSIARINGLLSGRYNTTHRFYQLTAELAYKKHQLSTVGEEGGNIAIVRCLRAELARLAPLAQS